MDADFGFWLQCFWCKIFDAFDVNQANDFGQIKWWQFHFEWHWFGYRVSCQCTKHLSNLSAIQFTCFGQFNLIRTFQNAQLASTIRWNKMENVANFFMMNWTYWKWNQVSQGLSHLIWRVSVYHISWIIDNHGKISIHPPRNTNKPSIVSNARKNIGEIVLFWNLPAATTENMTKNFFNILTIT